MIKWMGWEEFLEKDKAYTALEKLRKRD